MPFFYILNVKRNNKKRVCMLRDLTFFFFKYARQSFLRLERFKVLLFEITTRLEALMFPVLGFKWGRKIKKLRLKFIIEIFIVSKVLEEYRQ